MQRTIQCIVATLASLAALQCHAAERIWTNPSGGVFSFGPNWGPPISPGGVDRAVFTIVVMPPPPGIPIPISFTGNAVNDRLLVRTGNVAFDLNGATYELTNPIDGGYSAAPPDLVAVVVGNAPSDNAALTINDGTLKSHFAHIGNLAGSAGLVHVTGIGSVWTNDAFLTVGASGLGFLFIDTGGVVEDFQGIIGKSVASQGVVQVAGAGSIWQSNTLIVGDAGTGDLTVSGGGDLTALASSMVGNLPGSHGTVTITGTGSSWTNMGLITHIGNQGTGILNIQNGASVFSNLDARIGNSADSDGTVLVTDAGSSWVVPDNLHVGFSGDGELTIANGGEVVNERAYIGFSAGSQGTVTVTGAGSLWTCEEDLIIGSMGTGSLLIKEGGLVSADTVFLGNGGGLGPFGSVDVDGAGSKLESSVNVQVDHGSLTLSSGGTVATHNIGSIGSNSDAVVNGAGSIWTIGANLLIDGNSELEITNGGRVTCSTVAITNSGTSVTVDGNNSMLTSTGPLVVESESNAGNNGLFIENSGRVSNTIGRIAHVLGFGGSVRVSGTGSTWTNSGNLYVGDKGEGNLTIVSGGQVSSTSSYVGAEAGSKGAVLVSGAGSLWTHTQNVLVGDLGTGTLNIENAGTVSTHDFSWIGWGDGGDGEVVIDGDGSKWNTSGQFYVGFDDGSKGKLTIQNGGALNQSTSSFGTFGVIGRIEGSVGEVIVTGGANSKWNNGSGELRVGDQGKGELTVQSGGTIVSSFGFAGYESTAEGTVTVSGVGSTLTLNSGQFTVGEEGSGQLTITNGGAVASTQGVIAGSVGGTGTVTIDGAGSKWTVSGGSFSFFSVGYEGTGELTISNGGSINSVNGYIGHFDTGVGTATITGAGSIWTSVGNLTLGGFSMGPTTGVGTLALNDGGSVNVSGVVQLYSGGTLTGNGGVVTGNVVNAGEVAPGNSVGQLIINGNYAQAATGSLVIEIGGATAGTGHDQLVISGSATLGGILEVTLVNDFMPAAGQVFDIINWTSVSGMFIPQLQPLGNGLVWDTSLLNTQGVLQVVLPGDYNLNGVVDAADYVVWRKNPGGFPVNAYDSWRANFGQPTGSGAGVTANAAVPEPTSLVLLMLTAAGWCFRRRRAAPSMLQQLIKA